MPLKPDWSVCRTEGCGKPTTTRPGILKSAGRLCDDCFRARRRRQRATAWKNRPDFRKKLAARKARQRRKLHEQTILAYGAKCACCGNSQMEVLQIDHYGPDRLKGYKTMPHRPKKWQRGYQEYARLRRLGYPRDGIRVLCANCNRAIRRSNGQFCQHDADRNGIVAPLFNAKGSKAPRKPRPPRTHCRKGHSLGGGNQLLGGKCKICTRAAVRARAERKARSEGRIMTRRKPRKGVWTPEEPDVSPR